MVNLCKVIERVHDEKHLNADFYAYLRTAIVQRVQEMRDAHGGDHIIPVVTGTHSPCHPFAIGQRRGATRGREGPDAGR